MIAAIDAHNRLQASYREETFSILAVNAWELLLKAKWLAENKNRLNSLYINEAKAGSRRRRYKKSRSGTYRTHGLLYLARKLSADGILDDIALRNLEAMVEVRDTAIHFYSPRSRISAELFGLALACVKNFTSAAEDWFGQNLADLRTSVLPISLGPVNLRDFEALSTDERSFLRYLEEQRPEHDDGSGSYAFAVAIEVKLVGSGSPEATSVRLTSDPSAPAIRLTEKQVKDRYPWDYKELTRRCKERYSGFKVNSEYHSLRKALENDPKYAHERRLDPDKPRPKKVFYSPAILEVLDRHYKR